MESWGVVFYLEVDIDTLNKAFGNRWMAIPLNNF
jgi:hypothetical protein